MKTQLFRNKLKNLAAGLLVTLLAGVTAMPAHAARTTTFYHTDHLGSVVALSNEAGEVIRKAEFHDFGSANIRYGSSEERQADRLGYTGKYFDRHTNTLYLGARFYDPDLGRFLTPDPVGFNEQNLFMFNRYAYGNNNPYLYVDPDGNIAFIPIIIGGMWLLDKGIAAYDTYQDAKAIQSGEKTVAQVASARAAEHAAGMAMGAVGRLGVKATKKLYNVVDNARDVTKGPSKADLLRQGKDVRAKDVAEAREILDSMPELRPGPGNVSPGMRDRRNSFRGDLINTKDPTSSKIHDRGKHADQPHFNIDIRDKNGVRHKPAIFIDD